MSCPDELTLDLWSAGALAQPEAETIRAHVGSCANCTMQLERWLAAATSMRAALDLDQSERAYLATLDLGGTWRNQAAPATDSPWGWIALIGVVAAFIAWTVSAQPFGDVFATANQVGLGTFLLTNAVELLLGAVRALIDVSTNPVLALSQPLLAVLALALLFWPRMKSAPQYLEGVRS
jgi:hypothetical protein